MSVQRYHATVGQSTLPAQAIGAPDGTTATKREPLGIEQLQAQTAELQARLDRMTMLATDIVRLANLIRGIPDDSKGLNESAPTIDSK